MSSENINKQNEAESGELGWDKEDAAEEGIERLLSIPDNKFLTAVPQNAEIIEDEDIPATERLQWAQKRILDRLSTTLRINIFEGSLQETENFNDIEKIQKLIEDIETSGREIGRGGDAVVIAINTKNGVFSEHTCYKIALEEELKRGRNSIATEVEMQDEFFHLADELENRDVGVPLPLFEFEVGSLRLIAMELLKAKSVDDILRGFGFIPEWFDVDRFCDSLECFINSAHERGLYHRDMHYGNIMISQNKEWQDGQRMGYVIDFGLSGRGDEKFEPYKKEVAGTTFTYSDDYGRISSLRKDLHSWKKRNVPKNG